MRRRKRSTGASGRNRSIKSKTSDGAVPGAHQKPQVDVARDVKEVDGVVDSSRRRIGCCGGDALDGAPVDGHVEGAAEFGGLFGGGVWRWWGLKRDEVSRRMPAGRTSMLTAAVLSFSRSLCLSFPSQIEPSLLSASLLPPTHIGLNVGLEAEEEALVAADEHRRTWHFFLLLFELAFFVSFEQLLLHAQY